MKNEKMKEKSACKNLFDGAACPQDTNEGKPTCLASLMKFKESWARKSAGLGSQTSLLEKIRQQEFEKQHF